MSVEENLIKTMDYSLWFSGRNGNFLIFPKKDTIGKGTSRGAEWCKFQLHNTFQWGVMSVDLQPLLLS